MMDGDYCGEPGCIQEPTVFLCAACLRKLRAQVKAEARREALEEAATALEASEERLAIANGYLMKANGVAGDLRVEVLVAKANLRDANERLEAAVMLLREGEEPYDSACSYEERVQAFLDAYARHLQDR